MYGLCSVGCVCMFDLGRRNSNDTIHDEIRTTELASSTTGLVVVVVYVPGRMRCTMYELDPREDQARQRGWIGVRIQIIQPRPGLELPNNVTSHKLTASEWQVPSGYSDEATLSYPCSLELPRGPGASRSFTHGTGTWLRDGKM
jgi:hypothetical protein